MKGFVIFDLDGTLLCSHLHICKAAGDALRELGLPGVEDSTIRNLIGETSAGFYENIVPDDADRASFIPLFRVKERAALAEKGRLYDGARELLAELRKEDFQLAICSNAGMEYIELALEKTGIRDMFQAVVSARDFATKSQAVKMLAQSVRCGNVLLAGDSRHDWIAAAENRIPFIAARYGYGAIRETGGASFDADSPDDILPLVRQFSLYSQLYAKIRRTPGARCIGVNGVDAAGKSIFAERFAVFLRSAGEDAAVVHLDDFHNPKALRMKGRGEIDAYIRNAFDLDTLANELLIPIRKKEEIHKELLLLDLDSDTYALKRRYDIGRETMVILEGVLLYREPIRELIDYKIFLDIGFDEVIRRATARDVPRYGAQILDKYRRKYIPVQQWYLSECKPREKSDSIVDNTDVNRPRIVSRL